MKRLTLQQQLQHEQAARRQVEALAAERSAALERANRQIEALTQQLETRTAEHAAELALVRRQTLDAGQATSIFLANMSHELRTPLNAIIGYSGILQDEARDLGRDDFVLDLQMIESAGKHLQAVLSDILALTKMESGQMDLDIDTFSIPKLIEEVVLMAQLMVNQNGNTLQLNYDDDVGVMRADETKVRQMLFNLLTNAAKFTEHGTITLTVERHAKTNAPTEIVVFQVADTGIGIPPEKVELMFNAFTQADNSTTRKYGGAGLGLTICQNFCRMMDGRLSVESRFGEGSTFTVTLPAEITEAAPAP